MLDPCPEGFADLPFHPFLEEEVQHVTLESQVRCALRHRTYVFHL